MILQTLKEGLKEIESSNRQVRKFVRKNYKLVQKRFRKSFSVSMGIRLALVSVPMLITPAYAASNTPQVVASVPRITLSKSISVIVPIQPVEIKPGDSNESIKAAEAAKAKRARVQSVAPAPASIAQDPLCNSLESMRVYYHQLESEFNEPGLAEYLEATHQIESGKSCDTTVRSYAGAQGPMQFLNSTFKHYCGTNCNIYSARDSIRAAANLLVQAKRDTGTWFSASLRYNHSTSYAAKVQQIALSINPDIPR